MLLNIKFFLRAFSTVAVAIIFFTFPPPKVPSSTPHTQALQLDIRRVNERNQEVMSRAIRVIFSLPRRGGMLDIKQIRQGPFFVAPESTT